MQYLKTVLTLILLCNIHLVFSHKDPCGVFQIKGNSYDIRPLTKHEDGGYEWNQTNPFDQEMYRWRLNICRNINKAPLCTEDTPVQQLTPNGERCVSYLGLINLWEVDTVPNEDNTLYWLYLEGQAYNGSNIHRTARIKLICDRDVDLSDEYGMEGFPNLTSVSINQTENREYYNFEWKSKHVCPIEHKLSPGSIILIIFFSILLSYVILGAAFQFFVRKARGINVIPNSSFWMDLPFLVKDGFMFMISPIVNLFIKRSGGYSTSI